MKVSYNWLKAYVPEIPEPKHLADLFTYHVCEVESFEKLPDSDYLFDLGILPNRAHDLLSHQGVAKELAGLLGKKFNDPTPFYKIPESKPTSLTINADGARRYMARIVRNVTVGPSPEWVKTHLESIGQRSINNIVDATNIVMYDCGQPCHAFDLDKVKGKIVVRDAQEGEKIILLDGKEVTLQSKDIVIADDEGPLALAGVKGGKRAEVTMNTKNILIEVANFFPVRVRVTARRLGIFTDSAKRFENDLSPTLCSFAMTELTGLLVEYGCTDFEDVTDIYSFTNFEKINTIAFSAEFIAKKLGLKISEEEIEKILKNYSYVYKKEGEVYTVEIPLLRLDLTAPEDMVEEIGRVYGYDKVLPQMPKIDFVPKPNDVYEKIRAVREKLIADGYREVMTYAFANTGDVEVLASASDKKFLRTNLTDGLKKSYEMNKLNMPLIEATEGNPLKEIKIFEIGTVFKNGNETINVAYANKKEIKEMALTEFAESSTQVLGSLLQSQSREKAQPDHSLNLSANSVFTSWSLYPFIARDIAVWVPEEVKSETLKEIYKEFGTELLQGEPVLFDQFTKHAPPEGGGTKTSYAFRLVFQAYDRTLTDNEVAVIIEHIVEKLTSLGYEVR